MPLCTRSQSSASSEKPSAGQFRPWELRRSGCSQGQFQRVGPGTRHTAQLARCTVTSLGQRRGLQTGHLLGMACGCIQDGEQSHLRASQTARLVCAPRHVPEGQGKTFFPHPHLNTFKKIILAFSSGATFFLILFQLLGLGKLSGQGGRVTVRELLSSV